MWVMFHDHRECESVLRELSSSAHPGSAFHAPFCRVGQSLPSSRHPTAGRAQVMLQQSLAACWLEKL